MFKERDSLQIALWLINLSGLHPKHDRVRDRIIWITYLIAVNIMCPCVLIELVRNYKDIDTLASTMEAMMTYYQVTSLQ